MEAKKPPGTQLETQRLGTQVGTTTQAEEVDGGGGITTRATNCWVCPELSVLALEALCPRKPSVPGKPRWLVITHYHSPGQGSAEARATEASLVGAGAPEGIQQLPEKCLRQRERGDERYTGFFLVLALPSPINASYWPAPAGNQLTWERKKAAPCHRTEQNRKRLKKRSEGKQARVWPYDSEQGSSPL